MGQLQSQLYAYGGPGYQNYPESSADLRSYTIQRRPIVNETIGIHGRQYHFDRKIGQGGFGSVYSARRLPDGQSFAIKVVSLADEDNATANMLSVAFKKEITMSRSLGTVSRNIVHMFDFDFDRRTGLTYMIMELGQQDLEHFLIQKSRLSPPERKAIWRQLVNIALALYNRNIVHLDIKPNNLVMFPHNIVKLVDLGIAQKAYEHRIGHTGTIPYSAPEVTTATEFHVTITTSNADMWSWGAVLYRMTYMTRPTYESPCYSPPMNQNQARDPHLLDVLRHTLVKDPHSRPEPPWLAKHPYTKTP